VRALLCCLIALASAMPAWAQAVSEAGRLFVTVADPSGAVIPNARVTIAAQDHSAASMRPAPAVTAANGVAVLDALPLGRYTIQAEFPGFETVTLRDVRVRAGDNRRSVTLPIKKVAEDVTVGRDRQSAGLDPLGNAFSTVLTREQIAALPDDPEEMERVLKAMAPPGSTIRVDGFTGGRLPPKSQIRSIRLPRMDMFAAQNHGGMMGMHFIDVMTQPGAGPLGGSVDFTLRDDVLNARNPFTPAKGDEGLKQGGLTLSGAVLPNRSSFSLTVQKARIFDSGSLLAALPGSTRAEAIRRPTDRLNVHGRFDQAIGKDHMLRTSFSRNSTASQNLGAGSFDLPERAYATDSADSVFRVSENGPLGRRSFFETRVQLRWSTSDVTSALEAPTIRVLDAFTSGGAQVSGGRRTFDLEAAADLDYVRGPHSARVGVLVEGGRYRSSESSNYLGTFTFASLADYEAGRAANYTRRIGDPDVRYRHAQIGVYAQDDFRLARSLMLSYGVRYETQSLVSDRRNFSPRASLTWSPLRSGRTTVRGGFGSFTDWLGVSTYEQTIRLDGFRQRELNIVNPQYPDPGAAGAAPATNRYLIDGELQLPESVGLNLGVDQALTASLRVSATYTHRRGSGQLRGRNLNAPVGGVRPDLAFGNVLMAIGDASARAHLVNVGATLMLLNWHRTFFAANYTRSLSESNSLGPFSPPASGDDDDLDADWGATSPAHRFGGAFNTQPFANFGVSINARAQSGTPYNVTTGFDDNGDGLFTDRPAGEPRNGARGPWQWDLGARLSYALGFGTRPQAGPGGGQTVIMIGGGGGGMPAGGFTGGAAEKRYRVEFYVAAQNLTNHHNYIGHSGVRISPFFGQPTNVLNPRKVEVGMRFGF
jgi:hypothetical protein